MKRLIVLFLLISSTAFPQAWKQLYSVPTKNTRFGIAVPKDVLIYEIDSSKIYRLTELRLPTDSMATAFRLNKYVTISGSSQAGSVDTTGWNMATKSDVPWYVTASKIKQRTASDTLQPNRIVKFAGNDAWMFTKSATLPSTDYAELYMNGLSGSMYMKAAKNNPPFSNSYAQFTLTPSNAASGWAFGTDEFGTFAYQLDEYGFYPTDYTTAGTYNQYLGIPNNKWKRAYVDTANVTGPLFAGKAHIGSTATPDSTLKVTGGVRITQGLNAGYDATINGVTVGSRPNGKNTILGKGAGNNTTGNSNTAVGVSALYSNTTASNLVAVGDSALYNNTTGSGNTAVGSKALYGNSGNGCGLYNTAIGYNAMKVSYGAYNQGSGGVAIGYEALKSNTTGGSNTAVGYGALSSNTTGTTNVAIGNNSLPKNISSNGNVAVGYNSLENTTAAQNIGIGSSSLAGNTSGNYNIAIGSSAGRYYGSGSNNNATSTYSTYIGYNTKSSASGNTNEIVIGNQTIGRGSNTTILGNTSTTDTYIMGAATIDSIPNDPSPDSIATIKNGKLYRALLPSGTTYTATSPMSVAGNDVHILGDTLTDWRAKMNAVAAKQDSVKNPFIWRDGAATFRIQPFGAGRLGAKKNGNFYGVLFDTTTSSERIESYINDDIITSTNATGLTVNGTISATGGTSTDWNAKMTNPMTTNGDLVYQHPTTPTRIPIGTLGQRLQVFPDDGNGLTLGWATPEWTSGSGKVYYTGGNVGVGTSAPSQMLEVGTTAAGGNVTVNATLGSELAPALTAGNWYTNSTWTLDANGWGKVNSSGYSGYNLAAISLTSGHLYKVVVTVYSYTSGTIYYWVGGVVCKPITGIGTYTSYITPSYFTTYPFYIYATSYPAFRISSISIKEVTLGAVNASAVNVGQINDKDGNVVMSMAPNGGVNFGPNARMVYDDVNTKLGLGVSYNLNGNSTIGTTIHDKLSIYSYPDNYSNTYFGARSYLNPESYYLTLAGGTGTYTWAMKNTSTYTGNCLSFNNGDIWTYGKVGIGTTTPTSILSLSGQAAQTFGMERMTTSNTAGNSLSIRAGGSTASSTDKLGGPLYYYPGISTGNATGISHQWYTGDAGSSGTTDQTMTAKMTLYSSGILDVPKTKHSATDTTGMGSTANVGMMMYYNGHFYGLIAGTPPLWKQLDN